MTDSSAGGGAATSPAAAGGSPVTPAASGAAASGGAALSPGAGSSGMPAANAGAAPMAGAAASDGTAAGTSGAPAAGTAGTGAIAGTPAGGAPAAGTAGTGEPVDPTAPMGLTAVPANTTVGLDWEPIQGASSYNVYGSTAAGVTPQTAELVASASAPGVVHRELQNGTTYYYVVTAVFGGAEGPPSAEATATPSGEWVLEHFGTGRFDDVITGQNVPQVPIEQRLHVLLFAEGYTADDLAIFHDEAGHTGDRQNDVDRWMDLVFSIEPYSLFMDAFVVWYIPTASNTTIRDAAVDTAFAVPMTASGNGLAQSGNIQPNGETATRAWAALESFPYPPTGTGEGGLGNLPSLTAAFLIYDPQFGGASGSGRSLSLQNPANSQQRLSAAFAEGHAHEFTHAFSGLRDEYLEDDSSAPRFSDTSNVTPSNACSELPWAHLLEGAGINTTPGLVGAFGTDQHGYHSEFLCLLNGTHDNANYYGGNGTLRVEDRMCNFCREITTYRIFQRSGILADNGYESWVADYRAPFYERFGMLIPDVVPQTNNVRNPDSGEAYYEACVDAAPLVLTRTGTEPISSTKGALGKKLADVPAQLVHASAPALQSTPELACYGAEPH